MQTKKDKKLVVLAYSGGLDTSVILKWLIQDRNYDVIAYCANLGQNEDMEEVERKANQLGAKATIVEDLQAEFVKDYVYPMLRANALYEGYYLLGTAIARPLIAKKQVETAISLNAKALSHGATGKGNDQIRFEFAYSTLAPQLEIIAPWREWNLDSRQKLIAYAQSHQIPITKDKLGEPPFSIDSNLLHNSAEGKVLEDPSLPAPDYVYSRTEALSNTPRSALIIKIGFKRGDAISLNGELLEPYQILTKLNKIGASYGIGRLDMVENRHLGMKSRGIYETPGGTLLLFAHKALEQITLDRELAHLKDDIMPRYARIIYNGFWFAPERYALQALIDESQKRVNGEISLKLEPGNVNIESRISEDSLYDENMVSFENADSFAPQDATGFINISSLRLKAHGRRERSNKAANKAKKT